ncbi:cytochrome c3 family protein [Campylobacter sp. VicNov18]|uniref:cytochrome c3 family protein n=1 Tax=Campylobacter bilis TaxID=2691918 RepID=UPI00130E8760|nr:cytochrome c3 family protein [Campylobacter bilis]MPV63226.1 cytochrome C [Campylobacter hepaticus]MBM0636725.1 cytochrome C [Campylobacter bilis]MCC8277297.1 cytochrome c3 family protein [Campylobacter bilis]MCC8299040.1 cytochrome c3 family protein [Campylobacter bilis]MCC8300206.1 cytochrome c3 family protein [Campylobacter bilis]
MKKIFISFAVLATCLWAKNIAYTDEVVSLYLNKDDTKVAGRLLPTNPFEILKTDKDKVLVKIDGYVNPKAPFVVYFNDTQRIIVAAFSKNTKLNFSQKIAGKDGKWDKVSLEIWADKKEFLKDNKEMLKRAKDLFVNNCGICHALHKEKEFNANAWPAIFRSMADRTGIDKKDRWLVIEYLQKNAKDFKAK